MILARNSDIMYDIIVYMISYMISYMKLHDVLTDLSFLAAADRPQAQRAEASDANHDPDRSMSGANASCRTMSVNTIPTLLS